MTIGKLRLTEVEITGFRGIGPPLTFKFDRPCTLFLGENGQGKSSVLNAVEWVFYGEEVRRIGALGIPERKSWGIENESVGPPHVVVKLKEDGTVHVVDRVRVDRKRDVVKLNGREVSQDELQSFLGGASIRDFATLNYLHQEILHALLIMKPTDRREAVLRLLGVPDLVNIKNQVEVILRNVDKEPRKIQQIIKGVEEELETRCRGLEERAQMMEQKLQAAGIPELTIDKAKILASQIRERLRKFARDYEVKPGKVPKAQSLAELETFVQLAKQEAQRLLSERPQMIRYQGLKARYVSGQGLSSEFEVAQRELAEADTELNNHRQEWGTDKELNKRAGVLRREFEEKKGEFSKISNRAEVVRATVKYLKRVPTARECPACERQLPAGDLRRKLHLWLEEHIPEDLKESIERLEKEIEKLESAHSERNTLLQKRRGKEETLNAKREEARLFLKPRALPPKADLSVLLQEKLRELDEELNRLEDAVKNANKLIREIETQIDLLVKFCELIKLRVQIDNIRTFREHPKWRRAQDAVNKARMYVEDLKQLKKALKDTERKEVEKRIENADEFIQKPYQAIVGRRVYDRLRLDYEKEVEVFVESSSSGDYQDALNLNQGDIIGVALSIFLGLAGATDNRLSFLILDDPSQKIDSPHIRGLVNYLNDMGTRFQLVIATADPTLENRLCNHYKFEKRIYRLYDHDERAGPKVKIEV